MACAAGFVLLLLLAAFVSNAAGEDVCRGKNVEQLVQLLGSDDVKKIAKKVETKVLLEELLKECKSHSNDISHRQTIEDALIENQTAMQGKLNNLEKTLASILTVLSNLASNVQPEPEQCEAIKKLAEISESELLQLTTGTFYFEKTSMSATMARSRCKALAMQLVKFTSVLEMTEVAYVLGTRVRTVVLAASGKGTTLADYKWDDGTTINSQFWSNGYPQAHSGISNQQPMCVYLDTHSRKLVNYHCSYIALSALCRLPTKLNACFLP